MSTVLKGIDISTFQGNNIDFNKVKKSGIDFVIIRAGYGREASQKDDCFEINYKNAKAAGLKVGAYWYSYAISVDDAKTEADTCSSIIKGKTFDLPVFMDLEEQSQFAKGKDFCSSIVTAFCDRMIKNGYKTGLYISYSPLMSYISDTVRNKYPLWIAQYYKECQYKGKYAMWQYTDGGVVPGTSGTIDMDYLYDTSIISGSSSSSSTTSNKNTTTSNKTNTTTDSQVNSSKSVNYSVKVTAKDGVNLRSGAGISYKKKGAVPYNTTLKITKQTSGGGYTWGYTKYDGITGWIALKYTKKVTSAVYYTVKTGDTLSSIAYKYNTTIDAIVKLNKILNKDLIYGGQKLRIK